MLAQGLMIWPAVVLVVTEDTRMMLVPGAVVPARAKATAEVLLAPLCVKADRMMEVLEFVLPEGNVTFNCPVVSATDPKVSDTPAELFTVLMAREIVPPFEVMAAESLTRVVALWLD